MTTVWMDPQEAKSSALSVGELALQIQETMTGTRSECLCEVPRSLIGWLDEELQAITVGALQVALGYLEQAVDVKSRADLLLADQSLVAAVTPPETLAAAVGTNRVGPWHETLDGKPYVPSAPVWDARYGWVPTAPLLKLTNEGWQELMRNGKADVGPGAGGGDPNIWGSIVGGDSARGLNSVSWGTHNDIYKFDSTNQVLGRQSSGDLSVRPSLTPAQPPQPPKPPPTA